MINIEKLDKLPDGALSQLSQKIESSESSKNSNNSEIPGIGIVDENEVLQGGNHAHLQGVSSLLDETALSPGQGSDKPATPPVITQTPGIKQPVAIGTLFNGKAGIELVDMLFPALIVLIADNLLGYEVLKKDLQLTAAEKQTIAPFMQSYLDSVNVHMSPLGALLAVMSGVYAAKFMEAFPNIKKKTKAKPFTSENTGKPSTSIAAVNETLDEINSKMNKAKSMEERRKQYAAFLLPMDYETAIRHIRTAKRMVEKDAKIWYRKNVEPLKTKR